MTKKPQSKVTIRDVADFVGVHHSTVSRALSRDKNKKISAAVRLKIERAAEKLGYFPNLAASSLKRNRSFAIGILIPDLTNPVFPPIIRGIQNCVEALGFTVIIANTDDEEEKELQALRMMQERSIEGLIIATARREDPTVDECIKRDIPFVLVNRSVDRADVNAVVLDEDFAIRSTLDHLFDLGHKRIAHIAGPADTSTGFERARAFRSHMRSNILDPGLIVTADKFTVEEGKRAFRKLAERSDDFTAVVAGSDLIALGCIDMMTETGTRVPQDVSIVGGNDIPFLSRMSPSLTSIAIPKYEMGNQGARALMAMLDGEREEPLVVRMQPRLVIRNSTARVKDEAG